MDDGIWRPRVDEFPRTIAAELDPPRAGGRHGSRVPRREGVRRRGEEAGGREGRRPGDAAPRILAVPGILRRCWRGTQLPAHRPGHDADLFLRPRAGPGRTDVQPRHPRRAGHVQPPPAQRQAVPDRGRPLAALRRARPGGCAGRPRAWPPRCAAGKVGILGTPFKGMGDFYVPRREDQVHHRRHGQVPGRARRSRSWSRRSKQKDVETELAADAARFDEGRRQRRGPRALGQAGACHPTLGGEGEADRAHVQLPEHVEEGRVPHCAVPGDEQVHGARHWIRRRRRHAHGPPGRRTRRRLSRHELHGDVLPRLGAQHRSSSATWAR